MTTGSALKPRRLLGSIILVPLLGMFTLACGTGSDAADELATRAADTEERVEATASPVRAATSLPVGPPQDQGINPELSLLPPASATPQPQNTQVPPSATQPIAPVAPTQPPPPPATATPAPPPPPAAASRTSTPPNYRVAFIGDSGDGGSNRAVLTLIKNEGARMVIHSGDYDYSDSPERWDSTITAVLGDSFPYFASIGNHDVARWSLYQQKLTQRLGRVSGASCSGDYGVNSACSYNGLFFVLSGVGTLGSGHVPYLTSALAQNAGYTWRICSWHKNMRALQVGGKDDATGWGAYETCRENGAIIATAHEHSYSRTKTLSSIQQQTVDSSASDPGTMVVRPGATFVFVSGLGGESIRDQERCQPAAPPYGCNAIWASIYTTNQRARYGALFIDFNVDGDPAKARGYFKNVEGQIVDSFTIFSR